MGRIYHELGTNTLHCDDDTRDRCPICKLQAVVDAAKAVVKERGIHRYHKPMDVAIDAMLDAIKEVGIGE